MDIEIENENELELVDMIPPPIDMIGRRLMAALRDGAPCHEIRAIVESHPRPPIRFDAGTAGLHYACSFGASLEIVKYLYEKDPHSITSGPPGGLAIHDACRSRSKDAIAVLQFLIDANPSSVLVDNDPWGRHLLHYVCQWNQGSHLMQYLIKQYPEALTMKDKQGYLPLHCRRTLMNQHCERTVDPLSYLTPLVDANIFTVLAKNGVGKRPSQVSRPKITWMFPPMSIKKMPDNKEDIARSQYLREREQCALHTVRAIKETLCEVGTHFQVPEAVTQIIWIFALPGYISWKDN
mmetsp:Transcript_22779/g.37735  ORF Transcript_22779/g.37735 Transcript_22779/m.37735 type:complete len:294 (-) Transcript_22779:96-977(-)